MEKEYEYIEIENIFSVFSNQLNSQSKAKLLSRLKDGWEIYKSEVVGTKEYIYKFYILRKEIKTTQQKIHEQ